MADQDDRPQGSPWWTREPGADTWGSSSSDARQAPADDPWATTGSRTGWQQPDPASQDRASQDRASQDRASQERASQERGSVSTDTWGGARTDAPTWAGWGSGDPQPEPQSYSWGVPGGPTGGPDSPGGTGGGRRRGLLAGGAALALVAALVAGGVGGYVGYQAAGDSGSSSVLDGKATLGAAPAGSSTRPSNSVAGISAALLPAVVNIDVSTASGGDTGSGVVIRSDGYILTNNHVISAAATGSGKITVGFQSGKTVSATIVGRDPSSDLAVIKVDGKDLKAAPLGNSDNVVVGDTVIAIGSPLGLSGTVTEGIISAKDRPVKADGEGTDTNAVLSALQTDAAINPGNSGGPLVNSAGEVIGINSAIATLGSGAGGQSGSIGVGFAIPINTARSIAEELIKTGQATHPVIGVRAQTVTDSIASQIPGGEAGALIQDSSYGAGVVASGPAAKAGLKSGDLIIKVDDVRITSVEGLVLAVRGHKIGDQVTITYVRDGAQETAKATLAGG